MNRRSFLTTSLAGAALASMPASANTEQKTGAAATPFKLKYAPSLDMFKQHVGSDPVDNIKFARDNGFSAVFDNGLMKRPAEEQEKIASTLAGLKMDLGPFVLYADFSKTSLVIDSGSVREMLSELVKQGIETAKRTNAKWALLVPGRYDLSLERDYQTANVIKNLKSCMELCEKNNLVIVLEPLNPQNHPGLFLTKIPQAYNICRAVDSPCCKIVDDLYHQQITEGNLIPNIDRAWSEIAAFHIGDTPGRCEPGTGEINYKNIFKHLHEKGYKGVLCMEHGLSKSGKEGEQALIEAYRNCDRS
jgi:hydroxypyruvate isomerase